MRGMRLLLMLCAALWFAAPGPSTAQDEAASGVFLVARPQLNDPNFRESVVLVTQHAGGRPVGVIINRPTRLTLAEVFPENEKLRAMSVTLFFGGPVSTRMLVFVFRADSPPRDSLRVLENVYMSFKQDLRIYAGYSGWGTGQLAHEMARGDWHMVRADPDTIFRTDPAKVWEQMLARASARQALLAPGRGPLAALAD